VTRRVTRVTTPARVTFMLLQRLVVRLPSSTGVGVAGHWWLADYQDSQQGWIYLPGSITTTQHKSAAVRQSLSLLRCTIAAHTLSAASCSTSPGCCCYHCPPHLFQQLPNGCTRWVQQRCHTAQPR
jgi:hypothetical protein